MLARKHVGERQPHRVDLVPDGRAALELVVHHRRFLRVLEGRDPAGVTRRLSATPRGPRQVPQSDADWPSGTSGTEKRGGGGGGGEEARAERRLWGQAAGGKHALPRDAGVHDLDAPGHPRDNGF